MRRDVAAMRRGHVLAAALVLSAGAHAALAIVAATTSPVAPATTSGSAPRALLATLRPDSAAGPRRLDGPADRPAWPRSPSTTTAAVSERPASPPAVATIPVSAPPTELPLQADEPADVRPAPITYPVLPLPADDDPHRVGIVRVLLVISSEGRVMDSHVTAATLSPEYVERVVRSFEAVRFTPASKHGFPHAGWYEVVVDFGFEPQNA